MSHPVVDLFWNFFPFTMVFVTPVRLFLNTVFSIPVMFVLPLSVFWNLAPEILILSSLWFVSMPLFFPHYISFTMDDLTVVPETSLIVALMLHMAW